MTVIRDDRGILRWGPWQEYSWLRQGFSTITAPAGQWAHENGVENLVALRQTHSPTVIDTSETPTSDGETEGDALVGARRGDLLTIRTADCLPVLLLDPVRRVVGAAHAGWRGMAAGIVLNTAVELHRRYASRVQDLEAVIGPCIRADNYEVGEEVAAEFTPEAIVRRPEWPRPHLDLPRAARLQLAQAGLADDRVQDVGLCTFANPDLFPSYRRDGEKCGRLVAAIGTV